MKLLMSRAVVVSMVVLGGAARVGAQTVPVDPPAPVASPAVATAPPWAAAGGQPVEAPPVPAAVGPTLEAAGVVTAERLNRVVSHYAEVEASRRTTLRWVGLGVGATSVLVGGVAMARSDPGEPGYVGGILALSTGAGVGLGMLLSQFLDTPSDELVRAHRAGVEGGLQGRALVESTERSWAELVDRQRRQRRVAGYLLMGIGTLLGLGGAALVMAQPGDSRDDRAASTLAGALTFTTGAALVVGGGAALHIPEPVESGWEVWRMAQGAP